MENTGEIMSQINKTQEEFFLALKAIQESIVVGFISKPESKDKESIFYDITSETICQVMTLIDGYINEDIQLDLIDKKSGKSLRTGFELHDKCVDYLRLD